MPVTLLLVGFAAWAFFWAADGGQFDDLDSPALAPLLALIVSRRRVLATRATLGLRAPGLPRDWSVLQ